MKKICLFTMLFSFLGCMMACTHNVSPNTYEACEAGVASEVVSGVVIGKRPVKIDANNNSGVGELAGAGIGAVAGSSMSSHSRGSLAGAIGGAILGGVVGNSVTKAVSTHKAYEYIINLNNGSTISIAQVQEAEFEMGQRVLVIYGSMTRIVADNTLKACGSKS